MLPTGCEEFQIDNIQIKTLPIQNVEYIFV
jgi:hypothetical protein